jgi:N-acetylneuraminic acid mutarotase
MRVHRRSPLACVLPLRRARAAYVLAALFLAFLLLASIASSPAQVRAAHAHASPVNTWSAVAPMPTARGLFGAATGPDGRIYAVGGAIHDFAGPYLNVVEAYDPKTNTWSTVAPMPTSRCRLAVVTGPDGRIYAIGGITGGNYATGILNTVEAYDSTTNTWSTLAPMPTAREGLAAATGPDGRIYAIGGYTSSNGTVNTVEAYDPKTNRWQTAAPMSTGRNQLVAAAANGRIYAIGGLTSSNGTGNAVEAYNPTNDAWQTVAPMSIPRAFSAATTGLDGRIYVVGGAMNDSFNESNTAEVYDAISNTWTTVATLPTPIWGLAAAAATDGRVFALGGEVAGPGNLAQEIATVEAYTPDIVAPTPTATLAQPTATPAQPTATPAHRITTPGTTSSTPFPWALALAIGILIGLVLGGLGGALLARRK